MLPRGNSFSFVPFVLLLSVVALNPGHSVSEPAGRFRRLGGLRIERERSRFLSVCSVFSVRPPGLHGTFERFSAFLERLCP